MHTIQRARWYQSVDYKPYINNQIRDYMIYRCPWSQQPGDCLHTEDIGDINQDTAWHPDVLVTLPRRLMRYWGLLWHQPGDCMRYWGLVWHQQGESMRYWGFWWYHTGDWMRYWGHVDFTWETAWYNGIIGDNTQYTWHTKASHRRGCVVYIRSYMECVIMSWNTLYNIQK